MEVLGRWAFLMSEVPLYSLDLGRGEIKQAFDDYKRVRPNPKS